MQLATFQHAVEEREKYVIFKTPLSFSVSKEMMSKKVLIRYKMFFIL